MPAELANAISPSPSRVSLLTCSIFKGTDGSYSICLPSTMASSTPSDAWTVDHAVGSHRSRNPALGGLAAQDAFEYEYTTGEPGGLGRKAGRSIVQSHEFFLHANFHRTPTAERSPVRTILQPEADPEGKTRVATRATLLRSLKAGDGVRNVRLLKSFDLCV
jgi:hypothetical protein